MHQNIVLCNILTGIGFRSPDFSKNKTKWQGSIPFPNLQLRMHMFYFES